jgi:hypothetical protein
MTDQQQLQTVTATRAVQVSYLVPFPPKLPPHSTVTKYVVHTRPDTGRAAGYDYLDLKEAILGWTGHGTIDHDIYCIVEQTHPEEGWVRDLKSQFIVDQCKWSVWVPD